MKFFGKELPTDKINFVMNIISFVLGVIFFIRMQYKMSEKPVQFNYTAERDSLITIQTRVKTELKEIKTVQDSLVKTIQQTQQKLSEQKEVVVVKRRQLYATIHSDWDDLNPSDKKAYVNKIMLNLSAGVFDPAD